MEQPGILEDHGVGPAEGIPLDGADVLAVHIDGAAVHVVEAHKKIDNGGLTRAGGTHDSRQGAGLGMETEVVDNGLAGDIGEIHIPDLHISPYLSQFLCIGCVRRLRLGIDESQYPLRRGKGALQLGDDVGHLVDGAGELPGVLDKAGQISQSHLSLEEQQ